MRDGLLELFGAGTALIGFLTFPAVSAAAKRLRNRDVKQDIYEDEDGRATPESMGAFSSTRPKVAILTFSATGLAISVFLILTTPRGPEVTLENLILIAASWVSGLLALC
jgi:hypothetical protein